MRGLLFSLARARYRKCYCEAGSLVVAVLHDKVATMLAYNLLRKRDSDSAVKGRLTVKREKNLRSIERSGIEMYAINFDNHVPVIESRGDGDFTTAFHSPYGGSHDGTEALFN
jgi:hypothetical protein